MRAILDANLLIRYLLPSEVRNRAVDLIVDAGLRRRYTIVTTPELRREVLDAIAAKPWLGARVPLDVAVTFLATVEARG